MNIKIILLEDYSGYKSGKEIIVRRHRYESMVEEGVSMRVFSPERLKAGTAKAEYVFKAPERNDEEE